MLLKMKKASKIILIFIFYHSKVSKSNQRTIFYMLYKMHIRFVIICSLLTSFCKTGTSKLHKIQHNKTRPKAGRVLF